MPGPRAMTAAADRANVVCLCATKAGSLQALSSVPQQRPGFCEADVQTTSRLSFEARNPWCPKPCSVFYP